jgi:predicted metal-dependent HD superfamily phosphohydrolase
MSVAYLEKSWFDLLQGLSVSNYAGAHKVGNEIFTDLIHYYSNPARYYHNLEHLAEILSLLPQVKDITKNIQVLQLSTWFHDCIYDPQAKDNEKLSAIYAQEALKKLKINSAIIYLVTEIIRSTQNHQPRLNSIDNLIFLDLDLAILGTTPKQYLAYAQAIRKEYQYLDDSSYHQGRSQVLTKFLNRTRIYYTDYFYYRLEATARHNIQTEINQLTQ